MVKQSRHIKSTLILAGVTILLAFAAFLATPALSLPDYAAAPSFSLTERSGRTVTDGELKGKVWIAGFFFTRCSGICPLMMSRAASIAQKMPDARFVWFSSDPSYDTVERLNAYAKSGGMEEFPWFFLTGPGEPLARVAEDFKFSRPDEPAMHSSRFVLIDKKGRVRGYYDTEDPKKMRQLEIDAKSLTKMR